VILRSNQQRRKVPDRRSRCTSPAPGQQYSNRGKTICFSFPRLSLHHETETIPGFPARETGFTAPMEIQRGNISTLKMYINVFY
jgi:hypothetical protein